MSEEADRIPKNDRQSDSGGLTKWDYAFGIMVAILGSLGYGLLWKALSFPQQTLDMATGVTALVLMQGRPEMQRSFRYWALRTIVFTLAIACGYVVQGGVSIWFRAIVPDTPAWLAGFPGTLAGIGITAAILLTTTERIPGRNTTRMMLAWVPVVAIMWTVINYVLG